MKPSTILVFIVLLLLIALAAMTSLQAYKEYQKATAEVEEVTKVIPVHVAQVETGSIEDVIFVTGKIEAAERVDAYAKIPQPGKLIKAKVKKGDKVRENQVLVTVDRDIIGAVYLAYAVKAPAGGYIAHIQDEPGSMVAAQVPVATIIDIDKVIVKTTVLEKDLGKVQEGVPARVTVDAYPGRVFHGTVTRIDPVLDDMSHTAKVEVTVSNSDHALKPSMFARASLVVAEKSGVLTIDKDLVIKRQGLDRAFVVRAVSAGDEGKDEKSGDSEEGSGDKAGDKKDLELRIVLTELELGYYDQENYEVLSGIEEGDLIVDEGLLVLKDRTLVTVMNPPEGWVNPATGEVAGQEDTESPPPPPDGGGADSGSGDDQGAAETGSDNQ